MEETGHLGNPCKLDPVSFLPSGHATMATKSWLFPGVTVTSLIFHSRVLGGKALRGRGLDRYSGSADRGGDRRGEREGRWRSSDFSKREREFASRHRSQSGRT